MFETILIVLLVALLILLFLISLILLAVFLLSKKAYYFLEEQKFESKVHPLVQSEVRSFLDNLQDAIQDGTETPEYSEIEINPGKFKILQGRLKGICKRIDNFSKGYLLSSLVHSGMANNPFILEELDLSGASCQEENFLSADLSRLVARGINLNSAILSSAHLENAKMSFSSLNNSRIDDAKAGGAYLNESSINNCYMKSISLERAYLIGSSLKECYLLESNLEAAILRNADLTKSNLALSKLEGANLSEAKLYKTILRQTNLQGATLSEAKLVKSYLAEADLEGADLWKTHLERVFIMGARFTNCYLNEAHFIGAYKDLLSCSAKELEKIQEEGNFGLYSSSPSEVYGMQGTDFSSSKWWLAKFDDSAARTIGLFLLEKFPAPNGLALSKEELQEFKKKERELRAKSEVKLSFKK